jgi:hypothetical protein
VQPDTQPHLAQTTTQQQLQLSPFLITIPNLTPHLQHVCLGIPKPKQGSQNGDARRKNLRTDSGILKQKQGSPNPYTKMVIPKAKWGCASNESPNRFGDPETKRGSPNPHTKTRIPKAKWGCASNESPNRFGDPRTKMGIKTSPYQNGYPRTKTGTPESVWGCESQTIPKPIRGSLTDLGINASPYQNGDPRIGLGIVQSLTRIGLGFVPIWDFRVSSPNWNGIQNGDPISERGSPYRFRDSPN